MPVEATRNAGRAARLIKYIDRAKPPRRKEIQVDEVDLFITGLGGMFLNKGLILLGDLCVLARDGFSIRFALQQKPMLILTPAKSINRI
jgi:hypothetical protein